MASTHAQIVMLFPHAFWGKPDMFGRIAPSVSRTAASSSCSTRTRTSPAGLFWRRWSPATQRSRFEAGAARGSPPGSVLAVLKGIFGPKGVRVPAPLQVRIGSTPGA